MFRKKILSTFALTTVSVLALSACGDDAPAEVSAEALQSAMNVDVRTVSDAEATEVLAAMGLSDAASGPFDWAGMTSNNGVATFTGWGDDDGLLDAESITFSGLHMDGSAPSFDKVEISGLTVGLKKPTQFGDVSTEVANVVLVGPNSAAAKAFLSGISSGDGFNAMSGHGFSAGTFTDMVMILDEDYEYGSVDKMSFGPSGTGDNINIIVTGQEMDIGEMMNGAGGMGPSMDMSMSIGSSKTANASPEYLKNMSEMMSGASTPTQNMFMSMTYDSSVVENFNMIGDGFSMSIPRAETIASKSGDVMTAKSTFALSTMKIDGLQMMGIGDMTFDGEMSMKMDAKADTMSISNANMDFKDQFQLDFAMDANGLIKFMEGMSEIDQNNSRQVENYAKNNMYDLDYMKFKFTDNSIMDKIWQFAADQQGGNVALMKQQATAGLAMAPMMVETAEQRKMVSAMTGALGKFIKDGGALTFEMRPAEGFSLSDMTSMDDPNEALDKLGLTLSHSN